MPVAISNLSDLNQRVAAAVVEKYDDAYKQVTALRTISKRFAVVASAAAEYQLDTFTAKWKYSILKNPESARKLPETDKAFQSTIKRLFPVNQKDGTITYDAKKLPKVLMQDKGLFTAPGLGGFLFTCRDAMALDEVLAPIPGASLIAKLEEVQRREIIKSLGRFPGDIACFQEASKRTSGWLNSMLEEAWPSNNAHALSKEGMVIAFKPSVYENVSDQFQEIHANLLAQCTNDVFGGKDASKEIQLVWLQHRESNELTLFVNVHLSSSSNAKEARERIGQVVRLLDTFREQPNVHFSGDFNIPLDGAIDSCTSDEARQAVAAAGYSGSIAPARSKERALLFIDNSQPQKAGKKVNYSGIASLTRSRVGTFVIDDKGQGPVLHIDVNADGSIPDTCSSFDHTLTDRNRCLVANLLSTNDPCMIGFADDEAVSVRPDATEEDKFNMSIELLETFAQIHQQEIIFHAHEHNFVHVLNQLEETT